jgi:hypothetical protein
MLIWFWQSFVNFFILYIARLPFPSNILVYLLFIRTLKLYEVHTYQISVHQLVYTLRRYHYQLAASALSKFE